MSSIYAWILVFPNCVSDAIWNRNYVYNQKETNFSRGEVFLKTDTTYQSSFRSHCLKVGGMESVILFLYSIIFAPKLIGCIVQTSCKI